MNRAPQDKPPPTLPIGRRSQIIYADNLHPRHGVPSLEDQSVALTLTSPPYWNFVDYAGDAGAGREASYPEYLKNLSRVLKTVRRKTIPGGTLVVNASNMKARKNVEGAVFIYPIVADLIKLADRAGWTFTDEIVWHKSHSNRTAGMQGKPLFGSYPYPPKPKILDSVFENILIFTNPGVRPKPSADAKARSRLRMEQWRDYTNGVWRIPPDKDPLHPATFPPELAERVVKLYSFVDDLILDPFAGSGSAVIAAERNERRGIGFEIASQYRVAAVRKAEKLLSMPLALNDTPVALTRTA